MKRMKSENRRCPSDLFSQKRKTTTVLLRLTWYQVEKHHKIITVSVRI